MTPSLRDIDELAREPREPENEVEDGRAPYRAVTSGHAAIDIFNSMGPVLVAFLRGPLVLSNAEVGLAVGAYQFLAGATQPPFGWLADRIGSRILGPLSVAWAVGGVALAFFLADTTSSYGLFLLVFSLAALGSGAFHPQGVMLAARSPTGRSETTTAVFFLCGQLGLTAGPALAGFLLAQVGPSGIYGLALATAPVVLFMAYGLRHTSRADVVARHTRSEAESRGAAFSPKVVSLLVLIYSCRGWVIIGTASLLPVMYAEMGFGSTGYGILTGLFWLGGALTGVAAGGWAHRFGRRPVVAVTMLLGSGLLVLLPMSSGWQTFVLSFATGAALGAAHSILIVMAQALLPVRQGLSSGFALGYFFGIGALASIAIGALSDTWAIEPVIQWGAILGVVAALLTVLLPGSRESAVTEPVVVRAKAGA